MQQSKGNFRDHRFALNKAWFTTGKASRDDDNLCFEENTTKIAFF